MHKLLGVCILIFVAAIIFGLIVIPTLTLNSFGGVFMIIAAIIGLVLIVG